MAPQEVFPPSCLRLPQFPQKKASEGHLPDRRTDRGVLYYPCFITSNYFEVSPAPLPGFSLSNCQFFPNYFCLLIIREGRECQLQHLFRNKAREIGLSAACMTRSKSRRTGANEQQRPARKRSNFADPRELQRMLRVAEEYDKLADHCTKWQDNAQSLGTEPREQ